MEAEREKRVDYVFMMIPSMLTGLRGRSGRLATPLFHAAKINMDVVKPSRGLPADIGALSLCGYRHQSPHCLDIQWSENQWGVSVHPTPRDMTPVTDHVDLSEPGTTFVKMKCLKDLDGNLRLFRPEAALGRFQEQCIDKGLPKFDTGKLLECISSLLRVDSAWIPDAYGYSTDITIETKAGSSLTNGKLVCVLNPRAPVDPLAYTAKVAGNPSPATDANLLLLDDKLFKSAHETTDAVFMLVDKSGDGKRELLTAPVDDPHQSGELRSVVLQLAHNQDDLIVTEEAVSIEDALALVHDRRVLEMFCVVSDKIHPVRNIEHTGGRAPLPKSCSLASRLDGEIAKIEYGRHEQSDLWTTIVSPDPSPSLSPAA